MKQKEDDEGNEDIKFQHICYNCEHIIAVKKKSSEKINYNF